MRRLGEGVMMVSPSASRHADHRDGARQTLVAGSCAERQALRGARRRRAMAQFWQVMVSTVPPLSPPIFADVVPVMSSLSTGP